MNVSKHFEIVLQPRGRILAIEFRQVCPYPVSRALKHGQSEGVLGIEMVIKAWLSDTDPVGDVLKAEAVKAARLDQVLRRI